MESAVMRIIGAVALSIALILLTPYPFNWLILPMYTLYIIGEVAWEAKK